MRYGLLTSNRRDEEVENEVAHWPQLYLPDVIRAPASFGCQENDPETDASVRHREA